MGKGVILVYMGLSYFPQLIAYFFFREGFENRYNIELEGVLLFCTILFFVLVFVHYGCSSKIKSSSRKLAVSHWVVFFIALAFLALSAFFAYKFDSSFRHSNRVSEAGLVVYALYVAKPLCLYIVLRYLFYLAEGNAMPGVGRVSCILIGVGCILSSTGSFAVFGIVASFAAAFLSGNIVRTKIKARSYLKYMLPALALAAVVVFTGFAKKVGYEQALELMLNEDQGIVELLVLRGSTSFVSGAVLSVRSVMEPLNTAAIEGTLNTLLYRLNFILPFNRGSGEYMESINRLNYEEIDRHRLLDRAGASPGLVASFLHLPFFPISLLLLFVYLKYLSSLLERNAPEGSGGMPLLMISSLALILPVFESPLSIFNLFDPVAVTFAVLIFGQNIELKSYA